ncbi:MAG: TetR/AcrR family transcriptional regulator, partial [Alphaproteobacteria bacterium]|nr:TetR/AcrR family transcriptional regulator [Alphaproteobacteria bacterium]
MNVHSFEIFLRTPDKHNRLLGAALELFESRGVDSVTVPQVAKAAGVATGTIYLYFKDKTALVNAVHHYWRNTYNGFVLVPAPPGLPTKEEFGRLWQRMVLFVRTYPRPARFLDLHQHAAHLAAENQAAEALFAMRLAEMVARGQAAGALRPLPAEVVTAFYWGAAAGLAKFLADDASFDGRTAAETGDALWRAI